MGRVLCPECGFECTHIARVDVDQGESFWSVMHNKSIAIPKKTGDLRGSVITLWMWCESSHLFTLSFRFHKGSTYVSTECKGDIPPGFCPELWRD